ncbi:hypothetical protein TB2_022177 [Malus domestica]
MAARAWLLVARQRGFQNLILECYSLQIMAALWDTSPFLSEVGNVVENSCVLMALIPGASYTHVCRQANGIAHRLAHAALRADSSCYWFEGPPDLILDLLFEESGL